MEQVKFSFDEVTIRKIVVGALIAGAGAVLTYVSQLVIDFGVFTPFATAIMAILLNSLREYSKGK